MDIIRSDTDYAMRALVHLALRRQEWPIPAKALAGAEDIPEDFAYKLLRMLTKAGLTESQMGVQGGFTLARDPEDVTLLEVMEAIQGPVAVRKCVLGKDECSRSSSCLISAKLAELQENLVEFLRNMTLAEVVEAAHPLEHSTA